MGAGVVKYKKVYTAADIAAIMSSTDDPWSTQRARRWLQATQAGVKRGKGRGRWVTTRDRLRDAFPEVWAEIVSALDRAPAFGESGAPRAAQASPVELHRRNG